MLKFSKESVTETGFAEQFLGLSQDGACTDLFEITA
jgi:hypothetical protein